MNRAVGVLIGACALMASTGAAAQPPEGTGPIQIVSALYGAPNAPRQISFATQLQGTCGSDSTACEAFCSRAFVGDRAMRWPFSTAPICRVVYRCGAARTRATDADLNDRISLNCQTR